MALSTRLNLPIWRQRKPWVRRLARTLFVLAGLVLVLVLFREPILVGLAARLDVGADPTGQFDAVYVVAGGEDHRAPKAATLYTAGLTDTLVTTGELVPTALKSAGIPWPEARLNAYVAQQHGVPAAHIRQLPQSTSTFEEIQLIYADSRLRGYKRIALVSSWYHLRRIRWVMRRVQAQAAESGMGESDMGESDAAEIVYVAAATATHSPANWWRSEEGLLAVNNEYMKQIFYTLNY